MSARSRKANEEYFTGKVIETDDGPVEITPQIAKQIYRYLLKNDYTDDDDSITDSYHTAKEAGKLAELPDELKPFVDQIIDLIDSVFDDSKLPKIEDGRKPKTNPLNDNFEKKEFQELWSRINRKAVYRVDFESAELIKKAVNALDSHLRVTPLQYTVQTGEQHAAVTDEQLNAGESFKLTGTSTEKGGAVHSDVTYDLIGKISEHAHLTRKTVASILSGIEPAIFDQFRMNPEHFIAEGSRLINEQKATAIIEQLCYDEVEDTYDADIFTAAQTGQDFFARDRQAQQPCLRLLRYGFRRRAAVCRRARHERGGCCLRKGPKRLPDPDARRRLQPRLGDFVQAGERQTHLFRCRDQGLYVLDEAA